MRNDDSNYDHRQWEDYDAGDLPVQVEYGSFQQFSRRIDRQLVELVERWAHTAAPNAMRRPGARFGKLKPK